MQLSYHKRSALCNVFACVCACEGGQGEVCMCVCESECVCISRHSFGGCIGIMGSYISIHVCTLTNSALGEKYGWCW